MGSCKCLHACISGAFYVVPGPYSHILIFGDLIQLADHLHEEQPTCHGAASEGNLDVLSHHAIHDARALHYKDINGWQVSYELSSGGEATLQQQRELLKSLLHLILPNPL
jgi:hypothetical protein